MKQVGTKSIMHSHNINLLARNFINQRAIFITMQNLALRQLIRRISTTLLALTDNPASTPLSNLPLSPGSDFQILAPRLLDKEPAKHSGQDIETHKH